jgi:hypothetical protein
LIIDGVFEMPFRLARIESPAWLHPIVHWFRAMRNLLFGFSSSLLFCFFAPSISSAQQSPQYEEVIFGFTLKDLGSCNISAADKNGRIYLPVMELFNLFEVYYTIEGQNVIKGTYLSSAFPMTIDPVRRMITVGDKRYELTQDDMFKGEMDISTSRPKNSKRFSASPAP